MRLSRKMLATAIAAVLLVAACGSSGGGASGGASLAALTPVKFQLQWVAQSQFAGYYAAVDQGYYSDLGLDVQLLLGGPNINNVQVVATGGADIGTAWLPNMLQSREGGTDLVSIAQIFQRSGTRMAGFKTANITTPAEMKGKKIGSWLGGNEPELFAALTKASLDPTKENVIKQNFDMSGLLKGDLDVAQAMIYNEYAQVLEAKNPATGELYKPEDLNVIDFNDPSVGTAMLQDQIFATRQVAEGRQQCRHRREVPAGHVQGLDLLPRQRPEVRRHRARQGLAARRQPPGLADERDQRADLAVAGRHRAARQGPL